MPEPQSRIKRFLQDNREFHFLFETIKKIFIFLVIALSAFGIHKIIELLEEKNTPILIVYILRFFEYAFLAIDTLWFIRVLILECLELLAEILKIVKVNKSLAITLLFLLAALSSPFIKDWLTTGYIHSVGTLNTDDLAKERVAEVSSLKADLEKLKVILPVNLALSDCMNKRKGNFKHLLEVCAQERKLQGEDPQQIIEKHRATLRLHFDEQQLDQIDEGLKSIRFSAYEMWNNQLSLEGWKAKGCPSNVTVLNTEEARNFMQKHRIGSGCAITVEKYESFQERDAKNKNLITSIREADVSVDNLNFLVVPGHFEPGSKTSIENFYYVKNNSMYGDMLDDIKKMTPLLKKLLEQ